MQNPNFLGAECDGFKGIWVLKSLICLGRIVMELKWSATRLTVEVLMFYQNFYGFSIVLGMWDAVGSAEIEPENLMFGGF